MFAWSAEQALSTQSLGRGERFTDNLPAHAGEPLIQALVEVSQLRMIQAHQVQNGGVEIGHVTRFFDGLETDLVRRPDRLASLHAGSREPHGKAMPVVIAPRLTHSLTGRRAAELSAPDQERLIP